MIRTAAVALLLAAGLTAPAFAASEGSVQVQSLRGYRMSAPALIADAGGVRVHGSICRASRTAAPAPRAVRLERLNAEGQVVGSSRAMLTGNLSGRPGLGCAYYDLQSSLAQDGETLRIQAVS